MRNIKQLLELMLSRQDLFTSGLCSWASRLVDRKLISYDEYGQLVRYIKYNGPQFKWYNPYMLFKANDCYYWLSGCKFPRVAWIKKHIKLNS
jgi:hypothetical protein